MAEMDKIICYDPDRMDHKRVGFQSLEASLITTNRTRTGDSDRGTATKGDEGHRKTEMSRELTRIDFPTWP